jgi:hypothetical protein
MKKQYIAPEFAIQSMETQQIIALSLKKDPADDSAALVKDANVNDWNIWGDEEEE